MSGARRVRGQRDLVVYLGAGAAHVDNLTRDVAHPPLVKGARASNTFLALKQAGFNISLWPYPHTYPYVLNCGPNSAFKDVRVRQALSMAAEQGLPGNHHFYLTFRTTFPGVEIAERLREILDDESAAVEDAARAAGIDVFRTKMIAIALSHVVNLIRLLAPAAKP